MKFFVTILMTIALMTFTFSASVAKHRQPDKYSNYTEYRADVDEQVKELGLFKLRTRLSKIIHEMDEPWDITYHKQCVAREAMLDAKYKKRTKKEDCKKHLTESPEYRYRRLEVIVDALVLELDDAQDKFGRKWFWSKEDLAFLALIVAYNESGRFNVKVHKGHKRGDCRPVKSLGGKIVCHSFSNFQIWSRRSDKYYRWKLVGYDDDRFGLSLRRTRNATYMAYQHLTYHSYRCVLKEKVPVENGKDGSKYPISYQGISKVLSGYASGRHCVYYFKRPKRKNGKKVRDANGKVVMVNGYEPMRRAKQYWALREDYFN